MEKLEQIAVPLDFSPFSKHALRAALFLARETGAQLHLLHVIPERAADSAFQIPLSSEAEVADQAQVWVDKEYVEFLRGENLEGVSVTHSLQFGSPAINRGDPGGCHT